MIINSINIDYRPMITIEHRLPDAFGIGPIMTIAKRFVH